MSWWGRARGSNGAGQGLEGGEKVRREHHDKFQLQRKKVEQLHKMPKGRKKRKQSKDILVSMRRTGGEKKNETTTDM